MQSKSESIARIDPLRPGQLTGPPSARDLLDLRASLVFVDDWERAAILGAMTRPTRATGSHDSRIEGAVDEAKQRPIAKPSWSTVALVLIGFGVFLALLALCGSR